MAVTAGVWLVIGLGGGGVQTVHADKHMFKYRNNGDLFECNDGGVYISDDNGTSWEDKTNGMVISQIYKLGISQTVADETIVGLQDCGTKLISNNTWDDVRSGDGMECLIDYTNVDVQYATVYYGNIVRTVDHWSNSVSIVPTAAGEGAWVTPFVFSPTDSKTIYGGYSNVWKTTNRGDTWTEISNMNTASKLRAMAIAPSNDQILYVSYPTEIWKTTNDGGTWVNVTGSLPFSQGITAIAVKSDDPNTVWVGLGTYNNSAIHQSTDGGNTWTDISAGLPPLPVYTIVQNHQVTTEVHLYAGTELGVYFKNDNENWIQYNNGLPNVKCGELEIYYDADPVNSNLRLASYGRGLWQSPLEPENPDVPSVQTNLPTGISQSTATLGGNVTDEGSTSLTERGVVYATTPYPTVEDNQVIDSGTGLGNYSIEVSGLFANTTYYTRAYAINASDTSYGINITFNTSCASFSLPFTEDFESDDFPPDCWTSFIGQNGTGILNNWEVTTEAQSGSKAAYVEYKIVGQGIAQDWLVSPSLLIESDASLSFYQKQSDPYNWGSEYFIMMSTTSQTDISTFSVVEQWGENDFSTEYSEKVIDLSSYAGQTIYLGFLMENNFGDDWYIDNIQIQSTTDPIWTGAVSTDWFDSSNWENGAVPDASADVVIPTGLANYPTIVSAASCNNLTLKSDATGDASLIGQENLNISGNVVIERHISGYTASNNGWHFLSSPVSPMIIAGSDFEPVAGVDDLFRWEETVEEDEKWLNYNGGTFGHTAFENGFGYLVAYALSGIKEFTGSLNSGSYSKDLTFTPGKGDGWNLIGNPYPSGLNWNAIDRSAGNISGSFYVVNPQDGSYLTSNGTIGDFPNGYIPPHQGFFVEVSANTSITMEKADQVHTSNQFEKQVNTLEDYLIVELNGAESSNTTYFHFRADATLEFDSHADAYKLFGWASIPQVYSEIGGIAFSINSLPHSEETMRVSLGIYLESNETLSLKFRGMQTFFNSIKIELEDKQTGFIQNIRENPVYSFQASIDDNPNRFLLHFSGVTGMEDHTENQNIKVYSLDKLIYVSSLERTDAKILIYNLDGKLLYADQMNFKTLKKINLKTSAGVYMVHIVSRESTFIEKLFLK
jgi:photosystem II stability/assembly factor-like uncharacterized protein